MGPFAKLVSKVNLKPVDIPAKRSILDARLGQEGASAGGYNTVLRIKTEITLDSNQRWYHFSQLSSFKT